jgi:hypothetical protein
MNQGLTLDSSVPRFGGQLRGYTSQEWEAQRSEIRRLYADENIPLKDVAQIMKTKYSFVATCVPKSSLRCEGLCLIDALVEKDSTRPEYIDGD